MSFLFVRRSRYEALRKDLHNCQIEVARQLSKALTAANERKNERKRADAAEARLARIGEILTEPGLAKLPTSESVLEGE